ncbi:hypothetical protein JAAARDRAFT_132694 [Jaapia argillacea MUCL 33604]|uniref:DDE-1 domain-containing protein n=1 Tax=Jaapia argillacea MUCL 33604 TaxID=933084 RepID=A0A067PRJ7_9AGAM|nr:hypothetical protein JAAARDRAFT_132694 [Jaapia argillacea MUCL 33604]
MQSYVTDILALYFNQHRVHMNRLDQQCLWQIDVWAVHRSQEFRDWMKKMHPWITLEYVPAGCMCVFQLDDVGMQRPIKHAIRQSAHADVVDDTLAQL